MSNSLSTINVFLHQADNLLPSRTSFVPELRLLDVDNVANVLHHTVEGSGEEDLVLVVVGDGDEKLGVPVVDCRTKIVSVPQGEFIRIASSSRIYMLV